MPPAIPGSDPYGLKTFDAWWDKIKNAPDPEWPELPAAPSTVPAVSFKTFEDLQKAHPDYISQEGGLEEKNRTNQEYLQRQAELAYQQGDQGGLAGMQPHEQVAAGIGGPLWQMAFENTSANQRRVTPLAAGADQGLRQYAGKFTLPLHPLVGGDVSGALMDQKEIESQAGNIARGGEQSTGGQFLQGTVANVTDMALTLLTLRAGGLGAVGAGRAYLGLMGTQTYDQSLKTGSEKGLQGGELHRYAATNATLEVGAEFALQKLGVGVWRKIMPKSPGIVPGTQTLRKSIAGKLGQVFKETGIDMASEAGEEALVQFGQNVNDIAHGIKKPDEIWDGVGMASAQGAAVGGLVSGGMGTGQAVQQQADRAAQYQAAMAKRQDPQRLLGQQIDQQQATIDATNAADNPREIARQMVSQQAKEHQAASFARGLSEYQMYQIAALKDPSREGFRKVLGEGAITPNRTIRDTVHKIAQHFEALNPQPSVYTDPTVQAAMAEKPFEMSPQFAEAFGHLDIGGIPAQDNSLREADGSKPVQKELTPVDNPVASGADAVTGTVGEKPAWHKDLTGPQIKNVQKVVDETPGITADELVGHAQQRLEEEAASYEEKRQVWDHFQTEPLYFTDKDGNQKQQRFTMTPSQIEKLVNSDETAFKGFDQAVEKLQQTNPSLTADKVIEILKEGAPAKPKLDENFLRDAAIDLEERKAATETQRPHAEGEADDSFAPDNQPTEVAPGVMFSKGRTVGKAGDTLARPAATGSTINAGLEPSPEATLPRTGKGKMDLETAMGQTADFAEVVTGKRRRTGIGRVSGKKALGEYYLKSGHIAMREYGDLTTLAHEMGHAIWENSDVSSIVTPTEHAELMKLGSALYPKADPELQLKEGYSEFLRMRLTGTPSEKGKAAGLVGDAHANAPKFFEAHEAWAKSKPGVAEALKTAADAGHEWFRVMGAYERGKSQLRETRGWRQKWKDTVRSIKALFTRSALEDQGAELREAMERVEKDSGELLSSDENAHKKLDAYRNTADGKVHKFIEWGQFDRDNPLLKTGKSLAEILKPVVAKLDDFKVYLFARSSLAYWDKKMNGGLSKEDAEQLMKELDTPEFRAAADELQGWIRSLNKYIGTYSDSYANQFKAAENDWSFYMPHKRVIELADGYYGGKGGQAGAGGPRTGKISAKRVGGGFLPVKEQLSQLLVDKSGQLRRAMQRDVAETLLRAMMKKDKQGRYIANVSDLLHEVPIPVEMKYKTDLEKILEILEGRLGHKLALQTGPQGNLFGRTGLDQLMQDLKTMGKDEVKFFGKADNPHGPDNVLVWKTVNASGKAETKWFVVTPEFQQMLTGIEPAHLKGAFRIFEMASRLFKLGTIGFSPRFGLIRNTQRDILDMLVKAPGAKHPAAILKLVGKYFATWGRAFGAELGANTGTDRMDLAKGLGLQGSHQLNEMSSDASTIIHRLSKSTGEKILDPTNWADGMSELLDKMSSVIGSSEVAARQIAFDAALKATGWKPGDTLTREQEIDAAIAYKETMGDYAKKGSAMRYVDLVIPFASTPITYGRSMGKALFNGTKQQRLANWAAGLSSITIPTIAVWLMNRDKEWYKKLQPHEKYGRLMIEIPGQDTAFLWQRTSESGVLFSAIPEALLDAAYQKFVQNDDKQAIRDLDDILAHVIDAEMPGFTAQLIAEPLKQAANKEDITSGSPIVPQREGISRRPAPEQYTDQTSETAKLVGRMTGGSPLRIEHAANSLTGGLSKRVTDTVEGLTGIKQKTREDQLSDLPVVGAVFPSGGLAGNRPKPIEDLYREMDRAIERQASVEKPETDAEKERRLLLNSATRVLSQLMNERREAKKPAEREAIMAKATKIAEEALDAKASEKGRFLGIVHGIEYRMETDETAREKQVYRMMENLSDSKPRLGRGGVTQQNFSSRDARYQQQQEKAKAFLEESGVDKKAALRTFESATRLGVGPEKIGMVRSPEARAIRLRRLRAELGE